MPAVSPFYIIDANVMIEAANNYYTFDRVPGFWVWLAASCAAGSVRSVSLVSDEVDSPSELVDWLQEREQEGLFLDVSDPHVQVEYQRMATWIVQEPFGPEHIAKFLNGADLWIIAAASVNQWNVVSQETLAGPGTKKIKIPNVCDHFSVTWMNTFDMLNELGARF